eukprot:gene43104-57346_t
MAGWQPVCDRRKEGGGPIYYSARNGAANYWKRAVHNPSVLYQDVASFTNAAAGVSAVSIAVDNKGHVSLSYDKGLHTRFVSNSVALATTIHQPTAAIPVAIIRTFIRSIYGTIHFPIETANLQTRGRAEVISIIQAFHTADWTAIAAECGNPVLTRPLSQLGIADG